MLKEYFDSLTRFAKANGISRLDFYAEKITEHSINIYQQQLERSVFAEEYVVFIEGEFNGMRGYTYAEDLSDRLFPEHVMHIKQTAQHNGARFVPRNVFPIAAHNMAPAGPLTQHSISALAAAEKRGLDFDARIMHVNQCVASSRAKTIVLADDQGGLMTDCVHFNSARINVVASDGEQMQTASQHKIVRPSGQIDYLRLATNAAEQATSMLAAAPVPTGKYPVILQNNVVCDILEAFLPAFYGNNIQNKMSTLAGKFGKIIGSSAVTLVEDPGLEDGVVTRRFDDEGSPTSRKEVISAGVLGAALHNLQSAGVANISPTGNGFKRQYRERPTVCATNIYMVNGEHNIDDLKEKMQSGLLIVNCDGMFIGANSVSGDFSLISKGYKIENGEVARPVNQITIAGNFFDMLQHVVSVGNDPTSIGSYLSSITAPSLFVDNLSISGL